MLFRKNVIRNIFKLSKSNNDGFIVFQINSDGRSEEMALEIGKDLDADIAIEKTINDINSIDRTRFFHWFDFKRQEIILSDIYDGDFEIKIFPASSYDGKPHRSAPDIIGIVNEHIKSS